jgi:hypothetical protein
MVLHLIFYGFLKNQISAQNPLVLAFDFIEKHYFVAKTDSNTVFLVREPHIPDWLCIMVVYINFQRYTPYTGSIIHNGTTYKFLRVLKKLNFDSKSICVSLRF